MFCLSDALKMKRLCSLEKREEVIVFLASVPEGRFCSLDYLCKNILPAYNSYDKKFQSERVLITSHANYLAKSGLVFKKELPFDPIERKKFAQKVAGGIIDKGPRKTKSVFALTKNGREELRRIKEKYFGGLKDEPQLKED